MCLIPDVSVTLTIESTLLEFPGEFSQPPPPLLTSQNRVYSKTTGRGHKSSSGLNTPTEVSLINTMVS